MVNAIKTRAGTPWTYFCTSPLKISFQNVIKCFERDFGRRTYHIHDGIQTKWDTKNIIRTDKRHLHKNPPLHAIACSLLYIFLSYIHTSPTALNQLLHAIGISLYQSSKETWALIAPIMRRSGKGWLSANAHCANCPHNDWGLEPHGIW